MRRFSASLALLMAGVLSHAVPAHARSKTDIVTLINGDKVTCEIKELSRGLLKCSTSAMSTVYIEWVEVAALESRYYFEIEDQEGYKYYGTPELTEEGEVRVTRAEAVVSLEKLQVVRITPIGQNFWSRLDGSISLGVSYTKGSNIGRVDFAFDARYRAEKNYVQLRATTNVTTDQSKNTVQREDASLSYQHLFARRVFSNLSLSTYRNDELGIAFRGTFGAGAGAHIVQTNHSLLDSALGLSVNREFPSDPTVPPSNNLEGVLSLGYKLFKYNTPKSDISSLAAAYPRLPKFDRLRVDIELSWSQEIVKDFTIVLTFYDNYNSQPPSELDAKNDWGLTTSIGYKF